jgi:2'-5' RNA ligase
MDPIASSSSDRLFLAALPDAETAQRIHRLAQVLSRAHKFDGKATELERLHVSLFFLGGLPEPVVRMACDAAAEVRTSPFEVLFDRAVSFQGQSGKRPLVLVGDDGLDRLKSFRRMLGVAMASKGLRFLAKRDFTPHVTLLYGGRMVEEYPVEPICWTVNEFVLIHSLRGHVHRARWPLRP